MNKMTTFDSWEDELYHHGIKNMKWGVRRWQNPDGTLTEAGKRRYGTAENFNRIQGQKKKTKYMTDDELRRYTARLEAEDKYRSLNRNKTLENVTNAVKSIADARAKRREYELEKMRAVTQVKQADAKIAQAKADKKKATATIVENTLGGMRKERKAKLVDAKDKRSKNTVRGAMAHLGRRAVTRLGTRIFGDSEEAWAKKRQDKKEAKAEERGRKKVERWLVDERQLTGYAEYEAAHPKPRLAKK